MTILKVKSFEATTLRELENKISNFIKNISNYKDFSWKYNAPNNKYEAFITYYGKDEE